MSKPTLDRIKQLMNEKLRLEAELEKVKKELRRLVLSPKELPEQFKNKP